ncbi:MAG TPA: glucose 1-dehydrogenase [Ktedonobacteraceae bacterium]|nr:glucose 1-dehydrogenase [Ktedonobacteraceae bacterium]
MKSKTAVITGSTKGIGKAIAFRLAQQGYNIVLNYVSDDTQAQQTLQLCQQITPHVLLIKADISNRQAVGMLMQETVRTFQSLNVLVNNAARVVDKPLHDLTEEDWDHVVNTNMKGTFFCSQIASQYMLQQDEGGVILNIGASTGIRGRKNGINTCASKAGIMIMTQCLALELGPKIRVNTIVPGLTRTEEAEKRFHLDDPDVLQERTATIPLQRIGTPEDVADAVMLLLANESRFINGQKIVVDGGQYMW